MMGGVDGSRMLAVILISLFVSFESIALVAEPMKHNQWDLLLKKHVQVINNERSTAMDYAGLAEDSATFKSYLSQLSRVPQAEFDQWNEAHQLAFLINAYNAFTVALILTEYPDLDSIKEIGSFFSSPWKKKFISLLGKQRSLDEIEHKLIRGSGRYNDPRIHFAVNCASIGCPALRAEAYMGDQIDQQLQDQTRRFLSDTSRNRFIDGRLEVSSIFKWYREDFEKGWLGYHSLTDFFAAYAVPLAMTEAQVARLKKRETAIEFLDYDWRLNSVK